MNSQPYMLAGLVRCCIEAVPSIEQARPADATYRPCPSAPDDRAHGALYDAESAVWRSTTGFRVNRPGVLPAVTRGDAGGDDV